LEHKCAFLCSIMNMSRAFKSVEDNKKKADEAFKEGKKWTKPSVLDLRFKPDWEKAANKLQEAVKYYALCGDKCSRELVDAAKLCAEAFEKTNDYNPAAVNMEKAANECLKLNSNNANRTEAAQIFEKSAQFYRNNEQFDKAANILMKAAIAIQDFDLNASFKYIIDGCQLIEEEKRGLFSKDYFNNSVAFLLKCNLYDNSITVLLRHNKICEAVMDPFEPDLYRNLLSILVIRIHTGQYETAVNEFKQFTNIHSFNLSSEFEAAEAMIKALVEGSNEKLASAVLKQTFNYLANQVSRLARRLTQFDPDKLSAFLAKGIKLDDSINLNESDDEDEKESKKISLPVTATGELNFQDDVSAQSTQNTTTASVTSAPTPVPPAQPAPDPVDFS